MGQMLSIVSRIALETQTIQTVLLLRSSDYNLRHSDAVLFISVFTVVSLQRDLTYFFVFFRVKCCVNKYCNTSSAFIICLLCLSRSVQEILGIQESITLPRGFKILFYLLL